MSRRQGFRVDIFYDFGSLLFSLWWMGLPTEAGYEMTGNEMRRRQKSPRLWRMHFSHNLQQTSPWCLLAQTELYDNFSTNPWGREVGLTTASPWSMGGISFPWDMWTESDMVGHLNKEGREEMNNENISEGNHYHLYST